MIVFDVTEIFVAAGSIQKKNLTAIRCMATCALRARPRLFIYPQHCRKYQPTRAEKIVWKTRLGQSLGKSLGLLESRIGSDPILFLTIFPRLWLRLSSRLLVTNVTILLYCMVITNPRTGSSRDNTTVASWELGASFEIFLSKKFFCKLNLSEGFYCTYLKVYKKFVW